MMQLVQFAAVGEQDKIGEQVIESNLDGCENLFANWKFDFNTIF